MGGYEQDGHSLMDGPETVWSRFRISPALYVRQPNDWTCGPSVLQMMLQQSGRVAPNLNAAEQLLGTTEADGSSTRSMEQVLRLLAGEANVCSGEGASVEYLRTLLAKGFLVVIQFREPENQVGHYALVEGISPCALQLCDPYHGPACVLKLENLDWSTQFEVPQRRGWYMALKV